MLGSCQKKSYRDCAKKKKKENHVEIGKVSMLDSEMGRSIPISMFQLEVPK